MKANINYLYIITVLIVCFLSSCVNERRITYFQKGINQQDTMAVAQMYVARVQPGDIVSVYVNSLSSAASSFFNPYTPTASPTNAGTASQGATSTPALTDAAAAGFLVDQAGVIEIPLVGPIKIAGLTTIEAKELIKKSLTKYLKEPTVNVRVLNYKISMLGEVTKPSVYIIPNEKVSLPEALSMAGDLTTYGNREDIMVVRDVNGKKEFGHVDLTSREIYNSPYYYLHPNDLVYVKPLKSKATQSSFTYRVVPLVVAVATAVVLLISNLR